MLYYFVRHGETDYNVKKIAAGGGIDCPLTEEGLRQARILKTKIAPLPLKNIISSPMIRAMQTAEIISSSDFSIDKELAELNLGSLADLPNEECIKQVYTTPDEEPLPEGESKLFFQQRIAKAVEKHLSVNPTNNLFVAHGFVFVTLLLYYNLPLRELNNCEIAKFYLDNNKWCVEYF